jgi:hypothetical protein
MSYIRYMGYMVSRSQRLHRGSARLPVRPEVTYVTYVTHSSLGGVNLISPANA